MKDKALEERLRKAIAYSLKYSEFGKTVCLDLEDARRLLYLLEYLGQ